MIELNMLGIILCGVVIVVCILAVLAFASTFGTVAALQMMAISFVAFVFGGAVGKGYR